MNWKPAALLKSIDEKIWHTRAGSRPRAHATLVRFARLAMVLIRDLAQGQLTLRSMGLVYTTLLSIVPLLAISFSVLKAFGVYNQIRPALLTFLEPLGDKGVEVTARIVQFIENINVGVLGSAGLALLVYTAVSLMQKIEESFNFIWHVQSQRGIGARFSRYLSAMLIGPVLVFAAIGITAAVTSVGVVHDALQIEAIGWVAMQAGRLVPYALVIGAFAFFYSFMPNTRVRIGPALVGALVGGILWQSAGWAFAQFVASSTQYSAIYSGFAILILFMLWLYLNWLILLFGASVAFYVQHPEYVMQKSGEPRLSNRMRERLALLIMSLIARHHIAGSAAWSAQMLAQTLKVPMRAIEQVLDALEARRILSSTGEDPPVWLPARDLATIGAKELLDAVRADGEDRQVSPEGPTGYKAVEELMQRFDDATEAALSNISVRDLAGTLPGLPDAGEGAATTELRGSGR
jgi:membrane protein